MILTWYQQLNERARDITEWRRELERELGQLEQQTAALRTGRRELEHAQASHTNIRGRALAFSFL